MLSLNRGPLSNKISMLSIYVTHIGYVICCIDTKATLNREWLPISDVYPKCCTCSTVVTIAMNEICHTFTV